MKQSKLFNLNWADLGRGLLIAFLTALLGGVLELLKAGELPTTWIVFQPILELSLSAAVAYLLKNLFTNSEGVLMKGEPGMRGIKRGSGGKLMLLIPVLMLFSVTANAQQSPFDGFFHKVTPQLVAENAKAPLTGTWLVRWDVGLTCPSFGLAQDEASKVTGIEGRDFSKLFGGFLFTHVKPDGSRDWGVGGGITIPYVGGGRYGAAVLGGYSVFRVGLNYDFGLRPAAGLSFLGGITVDLFNLTE